MSAPETIGHPSHASENPRRSRLLWSHLEKVRSFRMNQKQAWFATMEGTPQGGTISPALANWTLDGLQRLLAEHFANTPEGQGKSKVHLVRYADDFLITG